MLPLHLENGRPKHRLRATRRGRGRRVRPGRDCLSRCEFPSSSRLTSAHMCAAFAAPVAMKCEIDARRGYRLRHRSRYIGHIQSLCDSRGLACGPMRFTANTRPDMRPGTVGRNDISAVLLSPGTAPIDSLTRRQTHGALHDKPPTVIGHCGGVLQREVVAPCQINYPRGISGLRVVEELGRSSVCVSLAPSTNCAPTFGMCLRARAIAASGRRL